MLNLPLEVKRKHYQCNELCRPQINCLSVFLFLALIEIAPGSVDVTELILDTVQNR